MATKYIATTGSDLTGDGSIGTPWATFYKGITTMANGDTLLAAAGTYNEASNPGTQNKSITVQAQTMPAYGEDLNVNLNCPAIDNTWITQTSGTYTWNFKGIRFYKGGTANYHGILGEYTLSTLTINVTYCHFYSDGVGSKLIFCYATDADVQRFYKCTFRKAPLSCIWQNAHKTNWQIIDCIFTDNYSIGQGINKVGKFWNNCEYNNYINYGGTNKQDNITTTPGLSAVDFSDGIATSNCKDVGIVVAGYVDDYSGIAPDMGWFEYKSVSYVAVSDTGSGADASPAVDVVAGTQSDTGSGAEAVVAETTLAVSEGILGALGCNYTFTPTARAPGDGVPLYLTDGLITSWLRWSQPGGGGKSPTIIIDLSSSQTLSYVRFYYDTAAGWGGFTDPSSVTVSGSNDNVTFTPVASFGEPGNWQHTGGPQWSNNLTVSGTYRYIKFFFQTSDNGTQLAEIEVYCMSGTVDTVAVQGHAYVSETSAGVDAAPAIDVTVAKQSESGAGVEAINAVNVQVSVNDTGSGADALAKVEGQHTYFDNASLVEMYFDV